MERKRERKRGERELEGKNKRKRAGIRSQGEWVGLDLAEAAPLAVGRKVCWRRRKGEAATLVGVRVVVGLQMGKRTEPRESVRDGERERERRK